MNRPAQAMVASQSRELPFRNAAAINGTVFQFFCILMCMFFFRDTTTGALRYYLDLAHLSILWFIPDALSLCALGYFAIGIVLPNASAFGYLILLNLVTAIAIGCIFMAPGMFAFVSAIKLFLPIFVGFVFCGRSVTDIRWMRYFVFAMMCLSTIGLLLAPLIAYPWVGASVDNFGTVKSVGRLWWAQTEVRYGGFAGDNTMAAYMCLFPYFMIHRYLNKPTNILLWIPIGFALEISTNKTSMVIAIIFVIYYVYTYFIRSSVKQGFSGLRSFAKWSFAFVPIPFVLIILLAGVDLISINPVLLSMQDRINNTWQQPFVDLADIFPLGIITGCGLGCFTYPMQYTKLEYLWVPVDNFFLATYVMFGVPFIFTIVGMFTATLKSMDREKLLLIGLTNIYCVTIQCYGPSSSTLLIGYAFSDMFLTNHSPWRRLGTRLKSLEA